MDWKHSFCVLWSVRAVTDQMADDLYHMHTFARPGPVYTWSLDLPAHTAAPMRARCSIQEVKQVSQLLCQCEMGLLKETLVLAFKVVWLSLVAFVKLFIPTPHKKDLSKEIVLITGAASGIGRLMALR